jgi:hypothetical protein
MLPPSPQGVGGLASAAQAKAEAAARARAAEQMALEDAWKALNPDFRTPFASVEDAVSRCVRARARSIDLPRRPPRRPAGSARRYHAVWRALCWLIPLVFYIGISLFPLSFLRCHGSFCLDLSSIICVGFWGLVHRCTW